LNRALSVRVRARCDLLGSSRARTSRRKSPHANSCRPSERETSARGHAGHARVKLQRWTGVAHTRSDWPCANVRSAIFAARVGDSTHVPIVGHMPTKHDTMRKPLALLCTIIMEMLLVKKVLSSQHPVRRGKCVDASCRCPTAAIGSSMHMRRFAMLMYVVHHNGKKSTVNACGHCTASCRARRAATSVSARRSQGPTYTAAPPRRGRP
jgi:hypothetical protein